MASKKVTEETISEATEKTESLTRRYLMSALTKDADKTLKEAAKAIKDAGATIEKEEDLGTKRLAYPIDEQTEMNLISIYFQASSEIIKGIEKELDHVETIARFLVTTWKADVDAVHSKGRPVRERATR